MKITSKGQPVNKSQIVDKSKNKNKNKNKSKNKSQIVAI